MGIVVTQFGKTKVNFDPVDEFGCEIEITGLIRRTEIKEAFLRVWRYQFEVSR